MKLQTTNILNWILLIGLVLIIAGCVEELSETERVSEQSQKSSISDEIEAGALPEEITSPQEEKALPTEEVPSAKEAIPEEVSKPKTADDCEKITDSSKKSSCYYNLAKKTKDIKLCEKTTNKNLCYTGVAEANKDASICEKVTERVDKGVCYSTVAKATKDNTLCEKGFNEMDKIQCSAIATNNADLCKKMPSGYSAGGYFYGSYFIDNCYMEVAIALKDVTVCEKSSNKGDCYSHFAGATKDVSICEKITDTSSKSGCYSDVAIRTNDASLCEKIKDTEKLKDNPEISLKSFCYSLLAQINMDKRLCEKITDSPMKNACYSIIAVAICDASLCEKITDSSTKSRCYSVIAQETKDGMVACVKKMTEVIEPSEEAQVIKLADESAFGKFSGWYEDAIEGEKNCDFEMFVSTFEKQGMIMDKEKRDSIKPYFDSAKQCWPSLEKKVEKIGGDKYRVIYSVESTSSCKGMVEELISSSQLKSINNQAVVVDLKTKEVEMPEVRGQTPSVNSWEDAYEQLETLTQQTEAIYGEDTEAMMDCSLVGSFAMFQSLSP